MPTTYNTPNMDLTIPLPGPTGELGPTYATDINTAFDDIDVHDHTTGKGVGITPAGININADLPIGSNSVTGVKTLQLDSLVASLATVRAIYSVAGELYYTDTSGNRVPITSGGALAAGSFGGVTGLGGTAAAIIYSGVTKTFSFTQTAVRAAKISCGDISFSYAGADSQLPITFKAPAGIIGAYSITWPGAVPSVTGIPVLDTSGIMSWNNVVGTGPVVRATGFLEYGTYAPTITSANGSVSGCSVPANWMYTRIGNIVTIVGRLSLGPVSGAIGTQMEFTLPIVPATFSNIHSAIGYAHIGISFTDGSQSPLSIFSETSGVRVRIVSYAAFTGYTTATVNFTYSLV